MKVAIFSDVHGNLTAMRTVLEDIGRRSDLDEIIFAGDLCFFGPRPQACVDLLKQLEVHSLVGNTDEWIRQPPHFGDDLPPAMLERRRRLHALSAWTAERLDQEALDWIDGLRQRFEHRLWPTSDAADSLLVVHANPRDLMAFVFPPETRQQALYGRVRQPDQELDSLLEGSTFGALAFGHIHIPSVRLWRGRPLVNVSSVSMPGDDDARAKYAILQWREREGWSARHVYLPYRVNDEIEAFRHHRPPNWESTLNSLEANGYAPQRV